MIRCRLLLACSLILAASAALAGEPTQGPPLAGARVVILSLGACCPGQAWGAAEARLATEFEALGLEVVRLRGLARDVEGWRAELAAETAGRDAAFGLYIRRRLSSDGGGAVLWLHDRVAGGDAERVLDPGGKPDAEAAAIAALRALEILRASLLALDLPSIRERLERLIPPAEPEAAAAEPEAGEPVYGIRLGVSGLGSPGGAGGHAALELCFSYSPIPALALEVEGLITMGGDSIVKGEAYATMDVIALRGWLLWEVLGRGGFRPAIGIGGGLLVPRARGLTTTDYSGVSDFAATGYLGGVVRFALVLSQSLWLRLGLRVGASLPEVELRFVERRAARFGLPLIEGFGAVELRW